MLVSKSEVTILLNELENFPIFKGLHERVEKRFVSKKGSSIHN